MKNIVAILGVGAVVAGCVNTKYIEPDPQPPRTVAEVKKTPKAPKRQKVVVNSGKNAVQPSQHAIKGKATALAKPLRVLVSLDDGLDPQKPSTLKRTLFTNVEGKLASSGFKVVYAKPAEILVYGSLRAQKMNQRGSRVSWKGDVTVEVTRAPEVNSVNGQTMRDVVAKKRFDVKSGDARNDDEALVKLSDRVGADVADFAGKAVNKVAKKMKIAEIVVSNAWQPQDAAGYPTLFAERVSRMDGVYSCRVVATDNANRTMKAEVIYDSEMFPDGFVNRLYITPELNIAR
ncbi:MAG: hypothetical protein J6V45_05475 [Kiritimatiellae bacterium]|nr:hypothetical protein [Kiritimatiellia bacterium]